MKSLKVYPMNWTSSSRALRGVVRVPGDKSLSHRALLLGALAKGDSYVSGFLPSGDCHATLTCLRALGVGVDVQNKTTLTVKGQGLRGLCTPSAPLNCVRSGTTMRLLAGILAGQRFETTLTGEPQLLRRPMRRIVDPLSLTGAEIETSEGHAPLVIRGRNLRGYDHTLKIASAQVKSALLLAGLYAEGSTIVQQPGPARDHTERMLAAMGVDLAIEKLTVTLTPPTHTLRPFEMQVPGDISSAAFMLVAASLIPKSDIVFKGVGVNPTRTGLLDVLRGMGADIVLNNAREQAGEPVADVVVRSATLVGGDVSGHTVVRMIDEFPIFAVAATQAHGTTVACDATELRVKETDRIAAVVKGLRNLGAQIDPRPDGFVIEGPSQLQGGTVDSYGDHRLAMALAVAGLVAADPVTVENAACITDSFPGFVGIMRALGANLVEV